ncbi:MAG: antA/AntB antirepressor family protein [Turicibacter sp.]|nr:antA/AntB antirepressor family protein [Turicibacter sp.]
MTGLINIIEENGQQVVSARELHEGLGLKNRFSKWVEQNFGIFEEGEEYSSVLRGTQQNQYGGTKEIQDYAVTLDMAKHLCMLSKTEEGKKIRKYFIEVEKQARAPKTLTPQQELKLHYKVLDEHEEKLNFLMDSMTVTHSQKGQIQEAISEAVNAFTKLPDFRKRLISDCYDSIKRHFHIPRYGELPRKNFDECLDLIAIWTPRTNLAFEIRQTERQRKMDLPF